jgi:DNA-directed RNA polymerase subunit F
MGRLAMKCFTEAKLKELLQNAYDQGFDDGKGAAHYAQGFEDLDVKERDEFIEELIKDC